MQPTARIDAVKIDHALIPLIIRQSHAHRSGTKIDPAGIGARYLAAVGLPAYNSAFGKILADPMHGHLRFSPEELDAVRVVSAVQTERALNEGTGSAGLFAIPFTLDPSIVISNTGALNPYRAISRIETIATKEWRGVSSDGVIAAYVPEATESTDASPVLAQPTIKAEQSRAFIPFSLELGQDWNGIQAELARLVSDAKDVLDATKFTVGSGTNEPTGVLTGLAVGQRIQTLTVAVYALGDPWLLKAAIPARFAASSTFVANPAIWDATYRFIGGNSAEPLQMPSREGPFLGRPKVEASAMVSTTTTGSKIILVGDFQHFCIVDRIGMGVELIPHLFGPTNRLPTGQRGLYAYWRAGSGVLAANAFRYLEVK
jgi:HK97 family phage major capsid protein